MPMAPLRFPKRCGNISAEGKKSNLRDEKLFIVLNISNPKCKIKYEKDN